MAFPSFSGGMRSYGGAGAGQPAGYSHAYGGIPDLPKYVTDTQTMIGTDREAEMRKNLPGYQAMSVADVGNIQANLGGRVAPDVLSLLQQQAAERGIGTGVAGAPNTDAAYLRALGLTSLQLQQLGHQQLTEAMARTPFQERQTTSMQRDLGAERAVYAAAPNPQAAAMEALRLAQLGISSGMGAGGYGRGLGGGMTYTGAPGPRLPFSQRPENMTQGPGEAGVTSTFYGAGQSPRTQTDIYADWNRMFGPGNYGNVSNVPVSDYDMGAWEGELGYYS